MASVLLQKTPYGSFGGSPGGLLANTKRDLSPSVTDKEEPPLTAEELARSLAERDAIGPPTVGPVSIDPTDWLTPGGLAKVGAVLKGVLTGTGASPLLVGAFRSANNSMLSRKVIEDISMGMEWAKSPDVIEAIKAKGDPTQLVENLLGRKLTTKELSKYGTPEFVLDKWLHSTNTEPDRPLRELKVIDSKNISKTAEAGLIRGANQELIQTVEDRAKIAGGNYGALTPEYLDAQIKDATDMILRQGRLFEDLNIANKQGKSLLHSRSNSALNDDVNAAIETLQNSILKHDIPIDTLENKSLQQIAAIVNKADDDAVRVLKKSMEAKNQVIRARTQELAAKQSTDAEGGFVRLETPQDLAQETDALNHCIGAVGRDNDKYIPAYDTVTGKFNQVRGAEHSSFAQYEKQLVTGASEFYSYRPKGLPEVTLEVSIPKPGSRNQLPEVRQAYGKEDAALTDAQEVAVSAFAKKKGFIFTTRKQGWIDDWEPLLDDAGNIIQAHPVNGPAPVAAWPFPINNGPIVPAPD